MRLVIEWLAQNEGKTRTQLTRDMYERLGLRDAKGVLRIS